MACQSRECREYGMCRDCLCAYVKVMLREKVRISYLCACSRVRVRMHVVHLSVFRAMCVDRLLCACTFFRFAGLHSRTHTYNTRTRTSTRTHTYTQKVIECGGCLTKIPPAHLRHVWGRKSSVCEQVVCQLCKRIKYAQTLHVSARSSSCLFIVSESFHISILPLSLQHHRTSCAITRTSCANESL